MTGFGGTSVWEIEASLKERNKKMSEYLEEQNKLETAYQALYRGNKDLTNEERVKSAENRMRLTEVNAAINEVKDEILYFETDLATAKAKASSGGVNRSGEDKQTTSSTIVRRLDLDKNKKIDDLQRECDAMNAALKRKIDQLHRKIEKKDGNAEDHRFQISELEELQVFNSTECAQKISYAEKDCQYEIKKAKIDEDEKREQALNKEDIDAVKDWDRRNRLASNVAGNNAFSQPELNLGDPFRSYDPYSAGRPNQQYYPDGMAGEPPYNANYEQPPATRNSDPLHLNNNRGTQNAPIDKDAVILQLMSKLMIDKEDKRLPEFHGDLTEWNNFASVYGRTTKDFQISNPKNMQRLRHSLKGEALGLVKHLFYHDNNVPTIMDILHKQYGRQELVMEHLLDMVKQCKSPNQSNPTTVVEFGTKLQALLCTVLSYNRPEYKDSPFLVAELADKLPADLNLDWKKYKLYNSSLKCNLQTFYNWFSVHVEIARMGMKPSIGVGKKSSDKKGKGGKEARCSIQAASEDNKKKRACYVCEKERHGAYQCRMFQSKSVDDRWKIVKEKGLCYCCLSNQHITKDCEKDACGKDGCDKKHNRLLHPSKSKNSSSDTKSSRSKKSKKEDNTRSHGGNTSDSDTEIPEVKTKGKKNSSPDNDEKDTQNISVASSGSNLPVVPIYVEGPNGREKIFAMLDTAASCSLIEEDIAQKIGLTGDVKPLSLSVFGNRSKTDPDSRSVCFNVVAAYRGAPRHPMEGVRTIKRLGIPGRSLNVDEIKEKYPYLKSVQMKNLNNAIPRAVVGFDYYNLFRPHRCIEQKEKKTPCAYRGLLGWYISLRKCGDEMLHFADSQSEDLHQQIKEHFSVENFGVKMMNESSRSVEDRRAEEILKKTTTKVNGRWQTGLLWKEENPVLPETKPMSLKRLNSMERKMDKDLEFAAMCQEKFEEYISKGFLKERKSMPDDASVVRDPMRCYIPWFFVHHSTKKPRLVFDAAAKSNGKCLNDFLLTGPDLLNQLPAVLMRFRMHQVALIADVKEMFHQVNLIDEDKPAQTILYRGMNRKDPPKEFEMQVLFFGSASSPCSAIHVKDTNAEEFNEVYPATVKKIKKDFYMDDLMSGDETEEATIKLYSEMKSICDSGGLPLVKWSSNNPLVLKSIPEELRATTEIKLDQKAEIIAEKTLGLYWIPNEDCFLFKYSGKKYEAVLQQQKTPTKRELLGVVMSLFDPLGFVAPLKVKAMILLQKIWQSGIGWDDEIPSAVQDQWTEWINELKKVDDIRGPRRYSKSSIKNATDIQLHTFCDASEDAYAAVSYLRIVVKGTVFVSFVMGKVRVAPLRGLTIPRMELQAALMGTRLQQTIVKAFEEDLKINKSYFWSDSRTVLCWLRSMSGRFNPFIANRVGEILDAKGTNVEDWHWIPTKLNVADDATRLNMPFDSSSSSRWLTGPEFLLGKEDDFPKEKEKIPTTDVDEAYSLDDCGGSNDKKGRLEDFERLLPAVTNFSSWRRLIKSTARVLYANRRFRNIRPRHVTINDMQTAKRLWIQKSQAISFAEEMKCLKGNKEIPRTSRIHKLNPYLEDGIIVLSGRINQANLPSTVKNPPILDAHEEYVKVMIQSFHEYCHHQGQELVINELRKEAWITGCRSAVRLAKLKCRTCRERNALPEIPMMGQLPKARLEEGTRPFHYTGVDYFGPFTLRNSQRTRSSVLSKRWGALFTCLTTRAVHLELAESLDTSDMIKVLTRFINRRGAPAQIWSDHGTNFVGGNRVMKESLKQWEQEEIANAMLNRGIEWIFVGPASPHMGGSWESQVKCVKRILYSLLKEQHPLEGDLMTFFTEVEHILNSRPITQASPDPDDLSPLTPNHLLNIPCVVGASIPGIYEEKEIYRKSWRLIQKLAQDFWKRWSEEYLPWLANRKKWHRKSDPLKVDDIVIVLEDNAPRNAWKKGRITKVYPAKDGQVRKVDVLVCTVDPTDPKKVVKTSEFSRPAVKICPLRI